MSLPIELEIFFFLQLGRKNILTSIIFNYSKNTFKTSNSKVSNISSKNQSSNFRSVKNSESDQETVFLTSSLH